MYKPGRRERQRRRRCTTDLNSQVIHHALLPPARIAACVRAGDDADAVGSSDEVDGIGKAAQERTATLPMDRGEAIRHASDLGEGDVEGAQELGAQALGALLIPEGGIDYVCLGGRADDLSLIHI